MLDMVPASTYTKRQRLYIIIIIIKNECLYYITEGLLEHLLFFISVALFSETGVQ
jgi:hypothetical protein